jgi:hypothetical protein
MQLVKLMVWFRVQPIFPLGVAFLRKRRPFAVSAVQQNAVKSKWSGRKQSTNSRSQQWGVWQCHRLRLIPSTGASPKLSVHPAHCWRVRQTVVQNVNFLLNWRWRVKDNEYKCAMCGGVFEKGWSDEEAKDELSGVFPGIDTSDCDLVCDDCYRKFMEHAPQGVKVENCHFAQQTLPASPGVPGSAPHIRNVG